MAKPRRPPRTYCPLCGRPTKQLLPYVAPSGWRRMACQRCVHGGSPYVRRPL